MFISSLFGFWFVIFPPGYVKPYYPCGDGVQAQVEHTIGRPRPTIPPGCRR